VVVAVKAAGIRHSDVGLLDHDDWSTMAEAPVVIGHEIAGVVESVGSSVTDRTVGDRVAVTASPEMHGFKRNGGYGEKVVAKSTITVPIPDGLAFDLAAAATDAGWTSNGAVHTAGQVKAGDKVGIVGFGGLGQIGTALAVHYGADVFVAEINGDLWARATEVGAKRVVKDVLELANEQLDVIIDFAGFGTATANAIAAVRPGGRVVQVGLGRLEATISTNLLVLKTVTLVGSLAGPLEDLLSVMSLTAQGVAYPKVEHIAFDETPDGIARLRDGKVNGRLVALY
jgi:propanol-preferring alcohol dehydrogenase